MGKTAEDSQFYKGKKDILDEFSGEHRALMSSVASRNLSRLPGYVFESSIMIEEIGKNKLSALNYQIISDAIERELKQTGHEYTQEYKVARIAFEIEKQTLLTDLQQEFADLDAVQSLSKEDLDSQFIELDIRKLILVTTKTAIELEMEGLRQDLIATDSLTFDNEALLINEKVNTVTAKLEIIPFLEALIVAQENILVAEQANIPLMNNLIYEKEILAAKKEELTPLYTEKADKIIELSDAIEIAATQEELKLDILISRAALKKDIVDDKINALDADIATENLRDTLYEARYSLQNLKIDTDIALRDSDAINVQTITNARATMIASITDSISAIFSGKISTRDLIKTQQLDADQEVSSISRAAEKSAIRGIATNDAAARTRTATAAATAAITSKLIHLIGS